MSVPISRRAFVRGLALTAGMGTVSAGSASVATGRIRQGDPTRPLVFQSPKVEPFRDQLPLLPSLTGTAFEVRAASALHRFHADLDPSPSLGYGGMDYLGPTIEAHAGEPTTVAFHNGITTHPFAADFDTSLHGLSERDRTEIPTSMHLHGGVTAPEFDGHPELISRPGEGFVHHFPNRRDSGSLWYHDHAMGVTRLNVYAGLAGLYTLRDEFDTGRSDNPLGLPAGQYEIPLVMQEKLFTADGRQSIRSTPIVPQGRWEGGAVGDVGVVNGKIWPELEVARGMYRLRLLNAASYSVWNLYFGNRMRFWVIGTEGGLLDVPVATTHVRLGPGERVDLLVDFGGLDSGATVELRNDEAPPGQAAQIGGVLMPLFCRFRVGRSRGFTGSVPQTLRGGRGLPASLPPVPAPQVFRNVTLSQPTAVRLPPSIMSLNNLTYSSADIEMPRQGTVEQWNIVNATNDPHPIHIHLVTFRVLGRQVIETLRYALHNPQPPIGTRWTPSADPFTISPLIPPEPWESGFKETVIANPNSITRIIVYFPTADELGFDPDATFGPATTGRVETPATGHESRVRDIHLGEDHGAAAAAPPLRGYVWHCHILDHEDHDMMLKFRTVA
ncbi:multicopper oxidase family protein [Rhodococcus sp. NPDC058481]|uniref:multicopper oxidase family protein n=1 Tax=unclassified Rhodococcus (in: high G+C Gram-positive bacteria) TaxID=192944 RepID=UPI003664DC2E